MSVKTNEGRVEAASFVGVNVLARLKADILENRYEPSMKLGFASLQKTYQASIGTLREALSHLVSDGLVHTDAGKGFRVAPVSVEDLLDISELRVDFERRALDDAIAHGDEDWEIRIIGTFHSLQKVERLPLEARFGEASEWTRRHRAFHRALVSGARSRWLLQFHLTLFDQAHRYRMLSQRYRPPSTVRNEEHHAIMEATLARDTKRACDLAEQHIRHTVEEVLSYSPQLAGAENNPIKRRRNRAKAAES